MQNVSENSLDLINQGCALMAQQQYEQALAKFLLAQKDSPKYIDCYVNLGNVYSCLEKYDDALENFKKALMLDEKSSTVLFDIGNIMYLKGDKIEAVIYIAEKMLASESELFYAASAKFYLAQAKSFRGDDDAEKVLREITKEFRRITIMNPEKNFLADAVCTVSTHDFGVLLSIDSAQSKLRENHNVLYSNTNNFKVSGRKVTISYTDNTKRQAHDRLVEFHILPDDVEFWIELSDEFSQ